MTTTTTGARLRFREAFDSWVARDAAQDDPGKASAEAAGEGREADQAPVYQSSNLVGTL